MYYMNELPHTPQLKRYIIMCFTINTGSQLFYILTYYITIYTHIHMYVRTYNVYMYLSMDDLRIHVLVCMGASSQVRISSSFRNTSTIIMHAR